MEPHDERNHSRRDLIADTGTTKEGAPFLGAAALLVVALVPFYLGMRRVARGS